MTGVILILAATSIVGYVGLFVVILRSRKKTPPNIEGLKETKEIMDTVKKLINLYDAHRESLIEHNKYFEGIFKIEHGFHSRIKQLESAVVMLQNKEIDSGVIDD